jgi:Holin of 3TMs, for gene-transfer release
MAGISDIVAGILKPISDVIDHVTVSGDQKVQLQLAQLSAGMAAQTAVQNYEQTLLDGQQKVIAAEASSGNLLTSSWRPITMLTFLALVVCDSFGWLHSPLAPQAWTLLQIGLGGYTVGRSVEKVAGPVIKALTYGKS